MYAILLIFYSLPFQKDPLKTPDFMYKIFPVYGHREASLGASGVNYQAQDNRQQENNSNFLNLCV